MASSPVKKHGWFAHYVFDEHTPYGLNLHTHGIPQSFGGQLDYQVVLPIAPEIIDGIFKSAVDQLRASIPH